MTGKEFMDRLEQAFPGAIASFYAPGLPPSKARDEEVASKLREVAGRAAGVRLLTGEIVAKARHRHGVKAFRVSRLKARCAEIKHAPVLGEACVCGEVQPAPQPALQALGPQARILFAEQPEPVEGPVLPEPQGLELSDASAAKVARHLFGLMRANAGTSAEVAS
jgi:hypothetical protein